MKQLTEKEFHENKDGYFYRKNKETGCIDFYISKGNEKEEYHFATHEAFNEFLLDVIQKDLTNIKQKVDTEGYAEFPYTENNCICEVQREYGKYRIEFYNIENRLVNTYKVTKFPERDFFIRAASASVYNMLCGF